MSRGLIGSIRIVTFCAAASSQANFRLRTKSRSRFARSAASASCGSTPAITCRRLHFNACAKRSAVEMLAAKSCSRPGSDARPRSPASQLPGGVSNSTTSSFCASTRAAISLAW